MGQPLETILAHHGFDLGETMPLFARLIPEKVGTRHPDLPLTPDRMRELTFASLLSLFLKMAQERPMALVIEDLHWADPTTVELVGQIVHELGASGIVASEPAPCLCIVLTTRPEFSPPWPLEGVSQIQPSRLGRDEVEQMIAAELASRPALPPAVVDQVVRHADGVPLFVEEVIRMLVESGALREADDLESEGFELEIPRGLRDLLTARLDLLSPSARATVQFAAALGREFRYELLEAIAGKHEALLREDMRELMDTGLLYPRRSVRPESYLFKHALIRDAAYESMVRPTRKTLHGRIAFRTPRALPGHRARAPRHRSAALRARRRARGRRGLLEARRRPHHGGRCIRRVDPSLRARTRPARARARVARAYEARGRPLRVARNGAARDAGVDRAEGRGDVRACPPALRAARGRRPPSRPRGRVVLACGPQRPRR
jgi:hypothetical protein